MSSTVVSLVPRPDLLSPSTDMNDKANIISLITCFFENEWPLVSHDDVTISRINSSYSSCILIVSRPETPSATEPTRLVVRLPYNRQNGGQEDKELMLEAPVLDEILACRTFASDGMGVRVFGVFDDGRRVDEFIDSHTLTQAEAEDPVIRSQVAKAYARFHCMQLPCNKRRFSDFNHRVERLLHQMRDNESILSAGKEFGMQVNALTDFDYSGVWKKLLSDLQAKKAAKCWCVIDPQFNNILISNSDSKVHLIDFEYVSFHFRAFDVGGHFFEKTIRWTGDTSQILRSYTEEEMRDFCSEYLNEWMRVRGESLSLEQEVDDLMLEARYGILMRIAFCVACCVRHIIRYGIKDPSFLSLMINLHERFLTHYSNL